MRHLDFQLEGAAEVKGEHARETGHTTHRQHSSGTWSDGCHLQKSVFFPASRCLLCSVLREFRKSRRTRSELERVAREEVFRKQTAFTYVLANWQPLISST